MATSIFLTRPASSASSSTLALLQEPETSLKVHALQKLAATIDQVWADASEVLPAVEALAEDASFPAHELAAFVASKMYYHLEAYGDAVRLALLSGPFFDITTKTEYVDTLVARCIDDYIASRTSGGGVDARLERVVTSMFARCWADGEWSQALGIALEAHRLDVVEETLRRGLPSSTGLLTHAYELVVGSPAASPSRAAANGGGVVQGKAYRASILRLLAKLHGEARDVVILPSSGAGRDHLALARVYQSLGDTPSLAALLLGLVRVGAGLDTVPEGSNASPADHTGLAYQIALETQSAEDRPFLLDLVAQTKAAAGEAGVAPPHPAEPSPFAAAVGRLLSILDGTTPSAIWLDFLSHHCKTDTGLLTRLKTTIDPRNSVLHHTLVITHGYMQCGTAIDSFLRANIDWYAKASDWHKFSAVASQGVVHKGHHADSRTVLAAYLPDFNAPSASPYAEGGALLALGLIHAAEGATDAPTAAAGGGAGGAANQSAFDLLLNALVTTSQGPLLLEDPGMEDEAKERLSDVVRHGACLGMGLVGMGSAHEEAFAQMRDIIIRSSATAGEAAGMGLGMLLLGKGPGWTSERTGMPVSMELLQYAHDSKHEKIIRGIAVGLALTCYGLEEGADALIRQMGGDKDALIRYGAMLAIGLAYVGTASNTAVRQLLHVAVSDVSDDVRRAAVMSLGFVLVRNPGEVPLVVSHLAESYNPHVRYGAAMAVGIACAGTGLPEAIALLEPLLLDSTDFVRQAALMSMGLVLQQESPAHLPTVATVRDKMLSLVGDRTTPSMARMGAVFGLGIMDAGGRNSVVSMVSRNGVIKPTAVVGVALWLQHWFWYPLTHFLSLAMTPTACVGLDTTLRIPTGYKVDVACRPSWFAYPPPLPEKKDEKKAPAALVSLSVTAKAKAKAKSAAKLAAAEKALGLGPGGAAAAGGAMEDEGEAKSPAVDAPAAPATDAATTAAAAAEAGKEGETKEGETKAEEKVKEPTSYTVSNPLPRHPGPAQVPLLPSPRGGGPLRTHRAFCPPRVGPRHAARHHARRRGGCLHHRHPSPRHR